MIYHKNFHINIKELLILIALDKNSVLCKYINIEPIPKLKIGFLNVGSGTINRAY